MFQIFIYPDIVIERMVLYNLYALQSQDPELASYSKKELKELTEHCLYHLDDGESVKEESGDEE